MSFNRVRVSTESSNKLKVLKARTGLTPNILCRIALTTSMKEPGQPNLISNGEDGLEFNRYTLTGEYDALFTCLIKERLLWDGLDPNEDLLPHFRAHLNRGISLLYLRVKSLIDLNQLLPSTTGPSESRSVVAVGE